MLQPASAPVRAARQALAGGQDPELAVAALDGHLAFLEADVWQVVLILEFYIVTSTRLLQVDLAMLAQVERHGWDLYIPMSESRISKLFPCEGMYEGCTGE